jgi:hypothetical protein
MIGMPESSGPAGRGGKTPSRRAAPERFNGASAPCAAQSGIVGLFLLNGASAPCAAQSGIVGLFLFNAVPAPYAVQSDIVRRVCFCSMPRRRPVHNPDASAARARRPEA